jgi:hypothetical protein
MVNSGEFNRLGNGLTHSKPTGRGSSSRSSNPPPRARLPDYKFHGVSHTAASLALSGGASHFLASLSLSLLFESVHHHRLCLLPGRDMINIRAEAVDRWPSRQSSEVVERFKVRHNDLDPICHRGSKSTNVVVRPDSVVREHIVDTHDFADAYAAEMRELMQPLHPLSHSSVWFDRGLSFSFSLTVLRGLDRLQHHVEVRRLATSVRELVMPLREVS